MISRSPCFSFFRSQPKSRESLLIGVVSPSPRDPNRILAEFIRPFSSRSPLCSNQCAQGALHLLCGKYQAKGAASNRDRSIHASTVGRNFLPQRCHGSSHACSLNVRSCDLASTQPIRGLCSAFPDRNGPACPTRVCVSGSQITMLAPSVLLLGGIAAPSPSHVSKTDQARRTDM